jgi:hypothetical protein
MLVFFSFFSQVVLSENCEEHWQRWTNEHELRYSFAVFLGGQENRVNMEIRSSMCLV